MVTGGIVSGAVGGDKGSLSLPSIILLPIVVFLQGLLRASDPTPGNTYSEASFLEGFPCHRVEPTPGGQGVHG